jgi:hypothetical protein
MGSVPPSRSTLDFIRSLPREQQAMGYRCYVEAERRRCPEGTMPYNGPAPPGPKPPPPPAPPPAKYRDGRPAPEARPEPEQRPLPWWLVILTLGLLS